MQVSFQEWERDVFGSVNQELARLRCDLEDEQRCSFLASRSRREKQLMSRITELLSREEIMAKQQSRIAWLKDGDRNIKLFQAKSRERANTN
jgi:hypothetical protein